MNGGGGGGGGGLAKEGKKCVLSQKLIKKVLVTNFAQGVFAELITSHIHFFPPWSNIILLPKFLEFYST